MPTAEWLRERYKRNRELGICPTCTINKSPEGGVVCLDCKAKGLARQQSLDGKRKHRMADRRYYEKLRAAGFEKLGNKCANPECRWLNPDGTLGCLDKRALQVDHVNGGGVREHQALKFNHARFYRNVVADVSGKYQLLCANCNWIKRSEKLEQPLGMALPASIDEEAAIGFVAGRLLEIGV